MKKYFPFFAGYHRALVLAALLVMLDVACEIVQPELMSKIVDNGVQQKNLEYILHTGLIMVVLSLVAIGANIGNIYYSSHASVGFSAALRKGLFDKIQTFSFAEADQFGTASLVTRLTNDVNIVQEVIMMGLRLLIRAPLMLAFAVIIAVRINAQLASIIAVAIPILSVGIYVILHRGLPYFEQVQRKLDQVNAVVQENLLNIRVVKSFVRGDFEKKKFAVPNNDLRILSVKASALVVMIMPVMQLVMNLSIVAIVWFGGNKIIAGNFQVGQLMSFITYITQILMSLMMLSMTIMTFSRAGASSVRMLEVLNTEAILRDSPAVIAAKQEIKKGKIEFKNVFFKYQEKSNRFILKNIQLTINPGERIAVIGATGSAKTTLVQLLPRLYNASAGYILIDDLPITEYTLQQLRSSICLVLQQNELFSGSIKENLRWGDTGASEEAIITAAKDAQAHDFIMSFPLQYETVLGQAGVNLSGGQKQRICLARAILTRPRVLILDDSTSAVDTATEAAINASFSTHLAATTIITISQRISAIQHAHRIVVMDNGEIAAIGTHAELINASALYAEIYSSQQLKETNPSV